MDKATIGSAVLLKTARTAKALVSMDRALELSQPSSIQPRSLMTALKRERDLAHSERGTTLRELKEPGDVLLRAIGHERVNPQGILRIGDALQAAIGMAGAIHFSMAAVDKNNPIGSSAPGTEVLQQVEETAITPTP